MKVSSKYKRFKHSTIMGDTFTLLDMRSSIIRTIWRYIHYPNMPNLRRFEKQAQIKEIDTPKTDRLLSVSDRALLALSYTDTVIITGHISRPSVSTSHGLILDHLYRHTHKYLIASRIRVNTKPKTYLIIEMIPFLVYYSYARKYHLWSLMYNPGYQCTNMFINVEIWTSMDRHSQ